MLDKNIQAGGLTEIQEPGDEKTSLDLDKTSHATAPLAAVQQIDECPECGARTRELRSSPIRVTVEPTDAGPERQEQEVPEHRIGWHCTACPWFWTRSPEELDLAEKRKRRKPLAGLGQVMAQDRKRGRRGGSSGVKGRRQQKPGAREAVAQARDARYAECVAAGMGGRLLGQPEKVDLLGQFLAERFVREDGVRVLFSDIYCDYECWCKRVGVNAWTKKALSLAIHARGYRKTTLKGGKKGFSGLRLRVVTDR